MAGRGYFSDGTKKRPGIINQVSFLKIENQKVLSGIYELVNTGKYSKANPLSPKTFFHEI